MNNQSYKRQGGANWLTAITLRWSVWDAGEIKARVEQARFAACRADALRNHADSAVHLEVRKA